MIFPKRGVDARFDFDHFDFTAEAIKAVRPQTKKTILNKTI
jgi:hypothetical protein